jgi:SIR2-like domain
MQLVKNGPDIPVSLLQAHEEGRVVLFCGAGVSYPAGLPGFKGLTLGLYEALGTSPTAAEQAALRRGQYDTAIGLLEGRIVGGREVLRHQVARILTPDLTRPHAMDTHNALLTLSRNRRGQYRLITTNFDRIFEQAIASSNLKVPTCSAPRLPLPKHRLDGLVYLHGLLSEAPTQSDLDCLVLSSGDFGLAYLIERWAARFVSELFRNFIVCFVGYSINDPVLRYMMDALAADRLLGESPSEVFAFGSYSRGRRDETANEWKAKNVTPILYQEHRRHFYLHHTLRIWSENYRDGILAKERIIVQYASTAPPASTQEDDVIGRVLWALGDSTGLPAKRFAELDPAPPLDWLEPLSARRFRHHDLRRFGVQPKDEEDGTLEFSFIARPTPYSHAPLMRLVENTNSCSRWDSVMFQLARWLLRHLNEPKLVLWVAAQGGILHPDFDRLVSNEIGNLSRPLQALWRVILSGRVKSRP